MPSYGWHPSSGVETRLVSNPRWGHTSSNWHSTRSVEWCFRTAELQTKHRGDHNHYQVETVLLGAYAKNKGKRESEEREMTRRKRNRMQLRPTRKSKDASTNIKKNTSSNTMKAILNSMEKSSENRTLHGLNRGDKTGFVLSTIPGRTKN